MVPSVSELSTSADCVYLCVFFVAIFHQTIINSLTWAFAKIAIVEFVPHSTSKLIAHDNEVYKCMNENNSKIPNENAFTYRINYYLMSLPLFGNCARSMRFSQTDV